MMPSYEYLLDETSSKALVGELIGNFELDGMALGIGIYLEPPRGVAEGFKILFDSYQVPRPLHEKLKKYVEGKSLVCSYEGRGSGFYIVIRNKD